MSAFPCWTTEKKAFDSGAGMTGVGGADPGLIGSNAPGEEEYFSHNSGSIEPYSYNHLSEDPKEALCTIIW